MYNPNSMIATEFIDHQEILDSIAYAEANKSNYELINSLIERAADCKGLTHREAAVLLECDIPELNDKMYTLAKKIKQQIYGDRIVMFAPLYLSNYCINGCVYCPYHGPNKHIKRKKLTREEVIQEVIATTVPKATTTKATTTEPPKTTMVTSSGTTASVSTDVPYDEEAGGNPEHTDTEIIEVTINEDKYICSNREISLYSLYNMIDKAKENGAVTVVIHDANATLKAYNALAEFLDSEEIDYIVEL